MASTGIIFPKNGSADGLTTYFGWTGAGMPQPYPLTLLSKWCPFSIGHTGYYGPPFWWGDDASFTGVGYFGAPPYPVNSSTETSVYNWEIAMNASDYISGDGGVSTLIDRIGFFSQALVTRVPSGTDLEVKSYFALPDTTKTNTVLQALYAATFPVSPYASKILAVGASPWAADVERTYGILRGLQIYTTNLSQSNVLLAAACDTNAEVLALGLSPWYLNMDPLPTDITDKSGNGNNPSWVINNAAKPWYKPEILPNVKSFPKPRLKR